VLAACTKTMIKSSCWMSSASNCWHMQSKSIVASNDTGTLSENECPSSLPSLAFLLYQECIVPLYGVTRTRTSQSSVPCVLDGRAFPCLDPFSRYRRLSNGRLYCIWICTGFVSYRYRPMGAAWKKEDGTC